LQPGLHPGSPERTHNAPQIVAAGFGQGKEGKEGREMGRNWT